MDPKFRTLKPQSSQMCARFGTTYLFAGPYLSPWHRLGVHYIYGEKLDTWSNSHLISVSKNPRRKKWVMNHDKSSISHWEKITSWGAMLKKDRQDPAPRAQAEAQAWKDLDAKNSARFTSFMSFHQSYPLINVGIELRKDPPCWLEKRENELFLRPFWIAMLNDQSYGVLRATGRRYSLK